MAQDQHPSNPQQDAAAPAMQESIGQAAAAIADVQRQLTRTKGVAREDFGPTPFASDPPDAGTTLASLDFSSLIGGPLIAAVNASAQSAMATAEYIQSVAFQPLADGSSTYEVKSVSFNYTWPATDGQTPLTKKVTVPLLSILPIPYLRVDSLDIEFKAQIDSVQTVENTNTFDTKSTVSGGTGSFLNMFESVNFSVSVSDQNVNTATSKQTSSYSMDVRVHAGVDAIPAGMQKVLDIFDSIIQPTQTSPT
jgi:hypothetical protein